MNLDLTRSAAFSTRLIEWLRGKAPILIVTHDHPDPDALAAAYALRHLILMKACEEAVIAFEGAIGRGENRAMVHELQIEAVPLASIDSHEFAVICMVDAQPGMASPCRQAYKNPSRLTRPLPCFNRYSRSRTDSSVTLIWAFFR